MSETSSPKTSKILSEISPITKMESGTSPKTSGIFGNLQKFSFNSDEKVKEKKELIVKKTENLVQKIALLRAG